MSREQILSDIDKLRQIRNMLLSLKDYKVEFEVLDEEKVDKLSVQSLEVNMRELMLLIGKEVYLEYANKETKDDSSEQAVQADVQQ